MFVHEPEPETDTYRCPAGQRLWKRFARVEGGKLIGVYFKPDGLWGLPIPSSVHSRQREAYPAMGA